jgi:predicted RNase H-like HicB family nuclease
MSGCESVGGMEEALTNIKEPIKLYLEPTEDDHIAEDKAKTVELAA